MNKIPTLAEAKEILGSHNVIDQESAAKIFKIGLMYRLMSRLFFWIPFSRERLNSCKGTHKLIFVFPVSIREMSESLFDWITQLDHYSRRLDGKILDSLENMKMGWHLIRIRPVEKQDTVYYESEIPVNGFVIYYTTLACFAHNGDVILENQNVECPDFQDGLNRFNLGLFKPFRFGGLCIATVPGKFSVDRVLLESMPNCKEPMV